MPPPSSLIIYQGWRLIDLLLRASNEGLRRPRVARSQKIIRLHPLLYSGAQTNLGGGPLSVDHTPVKDILRHLSRNHVPTTMLSKAARNSGGNGTNPSGPFSGV